MDINKKLKEAFKEILTRTSITGDVRFEKMCVDILAEHTGFTVVPADAFKEYYSEYKEYSHKIHKTISDGSSYNFRNILLSSGVNKDDNLIVIQPNGSQSSPDILIIHNKIGIPIEIKSSKNGKIIWNSGYPRRNYIYIFNSYKLFKDTTFFIGQDIISDEERELLIKQDIENKKINKEFNEKMKNIESNWELYPRAMFGCKINLFDDNKKKRENNVYFFIKNIDFI